MRSFIHRFDALMSHTTVSWPHFLLLPMSIASFLGQPIISFSIIGIVGVYGWQTNQLHIVTTSAVGFAGIVLNSLLKLSFGRQRPRTGYVDNMWFDTFSFPSGHASGSLIACGLLSYVCWHYLPLLWAMSTILFLGSLIIMVGVSRVYLGAHYASDVVGGWIIGATTLGVILFIIRPFS